MIVKNLTRKSGSNQLVNYLFKYFLKDEKQQHEEPSKKPLTIKHNLRTNKIQSWAKQFDDNEKLRLRKRKDNILLHHTIISFSNKDKEHINKTLLKDIAKKYIELRGKDNMFIATPHYDRDHIHLHIAMSGCKYKTGESNRISHKEFRDLKIELDQYQRETYPQLIHSLPRHGLKNSKDLAVKLNSNLYADNRLSQREQVFNSVNKSYQKSSSIKEFLEKVQEEGFEPYYRGGKLYGVQNETDRRFRFKTLGIDIEQLELKEENEKRVTRELNDIQCLRESKNEEQDRENDERIFEVEEDEKSEQLNIQSDESDEEEIPA